MLVLKETTPGFKEHIYVVSNDKYSLLGFQPVDGDLIMYEKAKSFSTKYRKFITLGEIK